MAVLLLSSLTSRIPAARGTDAMSPLLTISLLHTNEIMTSQSKLPKPLPVKAILALHAVHLKHRKWIFSGYVVVFMTLWTLGMITSFIGPVCRSAEKSDQDRLHYCSMAIATGSVFSVSSLENVRRSALFLERGKIYANSGQVEEARADFKYALVAAARGERIVLPDVLDQPHLATLFASMKLEGEQSAAYQTWAEALFELTCLDDTTTAAANAICTSQ